MAALRPLCPSGLGLGVSASQLSSFSTCTLSPRILQPLGSRRDSAASLLSLKTSTSSMGRMGRSLRHRHAVGAQKGAEEGPGPDPDEDDKKKKRAIEEQLKLFRGIFKDHLGLEKDMPFREDIERIDEYDKAMSSWNTSIFYIEATTFSLYLCMIAKKGVQLASRVMDSAALRLDKQARISSCTTKQTLMVYVSIFVKLVKDAHDKKFNGESVLSLLGAFRGVAAVGQILLQDAMANVYFVRHSNSLVQDVDDTWREFGQKMDNLEEKFRAVSKSTKAYEILRPTMTDAMILTIFFISAVVARHERLLGYAPGTGLSADIKRRRSINASDNGEPGASGTALQK